MFETLAATFSGMRGEIDPLLAALLSVAAGLVSVQLVVVQWRVSEEISEILPLVEQLDPGSTLLPLVFDNESPLLHRWLFDPELRAGGGRSPYFFAQSLTPVHLREARSLPAPGKYRPQRFRWERHGSAYRYFLVRARRADFHAYMATQTTRIAEPGRSTSARASSNRSHALGPRNERGREGQLASTGS